MGKRYCTYPSVCSFLKVKKCQIIFVIYHEYKLAVSKLVAVLFDAQIRRTLMQFCKIISVL